MSHLTCIQFSLFRRPQFGLKRIPQNLKITETEINIHFSQTNTHLDVFDRESESEREFTHFVVQGDFFTGTPLKSKSMENLG